MFATTSSSEPSARAWGIALGTTLLVTVVTLIVSAKTIQLTLPLLLLTALLAGFFQFSRPALRLAPVVLCLLVFLTYAGLSALWAPAPATSLLSAGSAVLIAAGAFMLQRLLRAAPLDAALHIAEGLWIGFAVGLVYALVETLSDQAIKIWAYNALGLKPGMLTPARYFTWQDGRLIAVHSDDLKRNALAIPLILWPSLMTTRALSYAWRTSVAAFLVLMSALVVFAEPGQTAKLALIVGSLAFVLARLAPRTALSGMMFVWILVCLGAIPTALLLHKLDLQNASWLQPSGQQRILIWNEIAHLALQSPFLGVGADMTYVLKPLLHETPKTAPDFAGYGIPHPHNVYLQVWVELGLVGILLLTLMGISCLILIWRLSAAERPYACGLFAASATSIGASYGMWQIWFMSIFGFVLALYGFARTFCGDWAIETRPSSMKL